MSVVPRRVSPARAGASLRGFGTVLYVFCTQPCLNSLNIGMPPFALRHHYGWASELKLARARLNFSDAAIRAHSAAPEAALLHQANVSVAALAEAFRQAVQLGYPYSAVTIADDAQHCLLDNFVTQLCRMSGRQFPLVVVCIDLRVYALCQSLQRSGTAASLGNAAGSPLPLFCVPVQGAGAPRARDGHFGRSETKGGGSAIGRGGLRRTQERWYADLVWLKPALMWLGVALGLSIIWSDLDVLHVQSPLPAFRWDADAASMEWICETGQPNMASTGFGIVHPSGLAAAAEWARMRGVVYDRSHASYAKYNEQGALWLLNERARPRMQLYKCLPKDMFLSGCGWRIQPWRLTERHYWSLHFSCLRDKRRSMRQAGLWRPSRPGCAAGEV